MVTLKTMLFFTGESNNGDFRVAQKTIMDRMNISEKTYYKARKQLEEMGWIHYDDEANAIYVNYDRIYSDYKAYRKMNVDGSHSSPIRVSIYDSPALKELQEVSSDPVESSHDDRWQGYLQERDNNIKNNISNSKNNRISSGGAVAAKAAPPQEELIKQMKEDDRKVYEWAQTKLTPIYAHYEQPMSSADFDKMHASDEWKQYLKELDEKRQPLRQKYGKLYEW